jgi:hypothetical protein
MSSPTPSVVPSLYDLSLQKSFYNVGLCEIINLVLPKNIIADQVGKLVGHGTFIYRLLLTPTDNLDSLMKSENLWDSIYSVRNFNERRCHCCSCDYDDDVDYRGVPNISPPLGGFTLASNAGSNSVLKFEDHPLRGGLNFGTPRYHCT